MDQQQLIHKLENDQFEIVAYYGYDTGYLNNDVIEKATEPNTALYSQINRIHVQARKACGLDPHVDNKSAVKIRFSAQAEPIFLCVYDYERTVCQSIVRRLGKEYFPVNPE